MDGERELHPHGEEESGDAEVHIKVAS
jgi:hypothetical protein